MQMLPDHRVDVLPADLQNRRPGVGQPVPRKVEGGQRKRPRAPPSSSTTTLPGAAYCFPEVAPKAHDVLRVFRLLNLDEHLPAFAGCGPDDRGEIDTTHGQFGRLGMPGGRRHLIGSMRTENSVG